MRNTNAGRMEPIICLGDVQLETIQAEIEAAGLGWEISADPDRPHPEGRTETQYEVRVKGGIHAIVYGFGNQSCLLAEALRRYHVMTALPLTNSFGSTKAASGPTQEVTR